jgi:hypothetical protein
MEVPRKHYRTLLSDLWVKRYQLLSEAKSTLRELEIKRERDLLKGIKYKGILNVRIKNLEAATKESLLLHYMYY